MDIRIKGTEGGTIVITNPSETEPGRMDVRLNMPLENGYPSEPLKFNMPAVLGGGGVSPRLFLEMLLAHSQQFGGRCDATFANYQSSLIAAIEDWDRITNQGDCT